MLVVYITETVLLILLKLIQLVQFCQMIDCKTVRITSNAGYVISVRMKLNMELFIYMLAPVTAKMSWILF